MTRVWVLITALLWSGSSFAAVPNWSVNPAEYGQSAALTAALTADFEPVEGADNLLAVFVGSEVRGVAAPGYAVPAGSEVFTTSRRGVTSTP